LLYWYQLWYWSCSGYHYWSYHAKFESFGMKNMGVMVF
jgi:hypothetical protein